MKTSIKLLVAALLVVVIALAVYNTMIHREYKTGVFRIPHRNFTDLNFKNFDTINVNSSTAVNVQFEQGPFRVRLAPGADEYARISQENHTLNIHAVFKYGYQNNPNTYLLIISCPKIARLSANGWYGTSGKIYIDTIVKDEWNMRKVWIEGFKQDSLHIDQDYASTVVLSNNTIGSVKAEVGRSTGSGSKIIVLKNNRFQHMDLDIRNKSRLLLDGAAISDLNYKLADSAKLVFSGSAQNLIGHSKSNQK